MSRPIIQRNLCRVADRKMSRSVANLHFFELTRPTLKRPMDVLIEGWKQKIDTAILLSRSTCEVPGFLESLIDDLSPESKQHSMKRRKSSLKSLLSTQPSTPKINDSQ